MLHLHRGKDTKIVDLVVGRIQSVEDSNLAWLNQEEARILQK
jgi:hypothetical protein